MDRKRVIPVEVYSRVVGYYRPVNQWNPGKIEEFNQRKEFCVQSLDSDFKTVEEKEVLTA